MCHHLDKRFFRELSEMDPKDVEKRTLAEHDPKKRCYRIRAWGETYQVFYEKAKLKSERKPDSPVSVETGLTIIFFMLRAKDELMSGKWISEKDLPGGVTFFRGPHQIPTRLITESHENLEDFGNACGKLGGKPADMADASYVFDVLPRVRAAVLYFAADEEFDAEAKLLFDSTIGLHLPLDVVFGLACELCARIGQGS